MTVSLPLAGLRVAELGEYLSAPFAGKLLRTYGADVIKIEPVSGDVSRRHGPFPKNHADPECSGLFMYMNAGKLGVTADVSTQTGRELVLRIVEQSDVLVHNLYPAHIEEIGLEFAALQRRNPAIVVASVTAFGNEGPYRNYKGYPITAAAAGGMSYRIGDPERAPLNMTHDRADYYGGIAAASGVMTAIVGRDRSGRGQHVDVSIAHYLHTLVNGMDSMDYLDTGYFPKRPGWRLASASGYPWHLLPCKDGYFSLIVAMPRHWERFIELMGHPAWADDPRLQDRRVVAEKYMDEMDGYIKAWLANYTKAELWQMFRKAGIPWHPVQTVADVMEWEQLRAREYWEAIEQPGIGCWTCPGAPFKVSNARPVPPGRSPRLGEHNALVYGELLGISDRELDQMRRSGIV